MIYDPANTERLLRTEAEPAAGSARHLLKRK
jgi:hypothetical protein